MIANIDEKSPRVEHKISKIEYRSVMHLTMHEYLHLKYSR
jgi:hypothetical protein